MLILGLHSTIIDHISYNDGSVAKKNPLKNLKFWTDLNCIS